MTLVNGDFESGWTRQTHTGVAYGEIFVPEGWVVRRHRALPLGRRR